MAFPFDARVGANDTRALHILAKSIHRELRSSGYGEREVIALATELVTLVTSELRGRRERSDA
jgi:hypothetical protein